MRRPSRESSSASLATDLRPLLTDLYGERGAGCLERVLTVLEDHAAELATMEEKRWSERDVVLITYADQVRQEGLRPLQALRRFLAEQALGPLISTLHLLPFFPYSSDDGFSVIDYRAVDPDVGTWEDVEALARDHALVVDLVLNHASSQSGWFQRFLEGEEPYSRYFIAVDPSTDLSRVTRPRSLPLLTPFATDRGTLHLWTTFSADQIDLDFREPEVLVEMIDLLLTYVGRGARIIRLDAIAYLWKEIGTTCIHLPQTHAIVKLLRRILDAAAPGVLLLTETNVPHEENVAYFGDGDEAHLVYQFTLPPLLLEALLGGDARILTRWLAGLESPPPVATYLNFTACHDGVGVRPLEGLLPAERLARLLEAVELRGGLVSSRRHADGADTAYELNISYVDALADPSADDERLHVRRFLASQALMLALRGIPAVYFHSLVGTPNDLQGVKESGQARRINRRKYHLDELDGLLSARESKQGAVFDGYRRLLSARILQPAFHPDAPQTVWETGEGSLVSFLRTSLDGGQRILVAANLGPRALTVDLSRGHDLRFTRNLLDPRTPPAAKARLDLAPYQVAWLEVET